MYLFLIITVIRITALRKFKRLNSARPSKTALHLILCMFQLFQCNVTYSIQCVCAYFSLLFGIYSFFHFLNFVKNNTISYKSFEEIFTAFITLVQLGTEINWLDFEVHRSKFKANTRANMVKNLLWWPAATLSPQNIKWWQFELNLMCCGCFWNFGHIEVTRSKVMIMTRTKYGQKCRGMHINGFPSSNAMYSSSFNYNVCRVMLSSVHCGVVRNVCVCK